MRALATSVLLALALAGAAPRAHAGDPPLRLYSAFSSLIQNAEVIAATQKRIEQAVSPRRVVYRSVSIPEILRLADEGKADIIIGNGMRSEERNFMRLGYVVTAEAPDPDRAAGSAVVTRKGNASIRNTGDLKGCRIVANDPVGYQGFLILRYELEKAGFDSRNFFSQTRFVGTDLSEGLSLLRQGETDAVVLPYCHLEKLQASGRDLSDIEVVGRKRIEGARCATSTNLYPGWCLRVSTRLDQETLHKIIAAIHSMRVETDGVEWGISRNQDASVDIFKTLQEGSFSYLRQWSAKRFLHEYKWFFASALLLTLALFLHSARARYLVRKRTRQLRNSIQARQRLLEENDRMRQRLERRQHAQTVSLFSSLVAHELSQPLAGISLYAAGLNHELDELSRSGGQADLAKIRATAGKIELRAAKAHAIVEKVRSFAKKGKADPCRTDLVAVIRETAARYAESESIPEGVISIDFGIGQATVNMAPLDLELVLVNLLRNSARAVRKTADPKIRIAIAKGDDSYTVSVADNGPAVDDSLIAKLGEPIMSLKDDGLGLGLSLVRSIMEAQAGHVRFGKSKSGGLQVTLVFPEPVVTPPA